MKAITKLDDVPEFQIGQMARVYFPDSAVMYGRCEPASGWISVKDAMPKTGYVYLITLNSPATMPKTMEAYLRHDGTWWRGSVSLMSEYVTHWMPLPEPPEEEEDETD